MSRKSAVAVAVAVLLTACGQSQAPSASPDQAAQTVQPTTETQVVQLGGEATGAGTLSADSGEIQQADPAKFHKEPGYSPYAGRRYPERPYFGDQHVHTSWSADAGGSGTTLGPEEALRFARGEEVVSTSGQPVKLGTPLDWAVITDRSDGSPVLEIIKIPGIIIIDKNPEGMA